MKAFGKLWLGLSFFFFFISMLCSTSVPAKSQPGTRAPYLIGANDVLNIFVWKEPDLTQDVVVMPDGNITFPLVGVVKAQGFTVEALRESMTEKLKKFVAEPEVTVIIKKIGSRFIYVIGKVNNVGPLALEQDMTVLQALSASGGFAEWASTKNILVVRREGGKETQIRFNYDEFIDGKNIGQNIILKPKDTIVVP